MAIDAAIWTADFYTPSDDSMPYCAAWPNWSIAAMSRTPQFVALMALMPPVLVEAHALVEAGNMISKVVVAASIIFYPSQE